MAFVVRRRWFSNLLLWMLQRSYPRKSAPGTVWQIIEIPRRISQTEADQLAEQVRNL